MADTARIIPFHKEETREMDLVGFSMVRVTGNTKDVYDTTIPHRHAFHELFIFPDAGGVHEIDFISHPVDAGSVHLVKPGQVHRLREISTGTVICFSDPFICLDDDESPGQRYPFLDIEYSSVLDPGENGFAVVAELVRSLEKEFQEMSSGNVPVIRSYLTILLHKLKSYQPASRGVQHAAVHPAVVRFRKRINERYKMHEPVSQYAEALNITSDYLNALCRKHFGRSAGSLIHERLVLEARRLLSGSAMQVKEIAYELNFASVPYFNRFFKKLTGVSPQEYRLKQ